MKELRPRKPKEGIPKPKESLTTAERAQRYKLQNVVHKSERRYRDCLRQDAAKWEDYLKSERERKRNERINRTEEQKQIDGGRAKNRLRQREYKKRQEEKGIKPKPKENKVLTRSQKEEQRGYWRERQKICRSKKSSQKKRRIKERDRNYRRNVRTKDSSTQANEFHESDDKSTTTLSCYSKEAVRKSASRCHLPSHAEKFAET
ncbi:unnamed protein product [Mytilus coruscus]|uniref:Uncharacterized protein n=1 Tax=Mytilus coruscus TaxID=42192 RepID=A0A6J8BPX6_MYTCO|nr:unnamed protein product [Mytilus coruscus]